MPRYAAVDVGSNSVRMLAADVTGGKTTILAAERQVTRLGAGVFQTGRISREAIQIVCEALTRMSQAYNRFDPVGVRAVATSAVRDAGNQQEFLEAAAQCLGTPLEVISGQEEARLIHLGVQARWPHPDKRILIVDVGGGSAEVILSENGGLTSAFSKPLGAVRLTEVFLKSDPPDPLELHRMREYIDEKLATPLGRIGAGGFDRVIATSATAAAIVCAVNRVPRPQREDADRLRAGAAQLRAFYRLVSGHSLAGRKKILGIGPRRAEIIIAGAAVFVRVLDLFEHTSLHYSAAGVRDGIIADLAARGVGRQVSMLSREQRRIVEQMARRYGVSMKHARKVAELAGRLFEALHSAHGLPPAFGKLLEAAAYLHDVGHYVSDTSHHKHSFYLIAHSDMPGFTDAERLLIATLCRYHRKSMPAARHIGFQTFEADSRRAILMMTPLLRLADSLDRGHEQRIDSIDVELRNGNVILSLASKDDIDLELWAAERTADVFREAYQLPLTVNRRKS